MSRPVIIKKLKEKNPKLTQPEIELIIDTFCEAIEKALINRKRIMIKQFGTFFVKKLKAKHNSLNPKTGEIIYVPERNKVRFKASKKFKEFINK